MKIQRLSTDALETPNPVAFDLPPQIQDRAVEGLCWVSLFAAVTSVVLTAIEHIFQPEFAAAWQHPVLRIASLAIFFVSIGFMVVQRSGWLSKRRLLDLGMAFQVAIAFGCEAVQKRRRARTNINPRALGDRGVDGAVQPADAGLRPWKSAITAALCVLMWPLAYWVDLQIYGFAPISLSRMAVWVLPLAIVAVWMAC
jgi:hypothetical protein